MIVGLAIKKKRPLILYEASIELGERISMFREKFRERSCFNRIRILKYRSFMRVNFSNGIMRNEDHIN